MAESWVNWGDFLGANQSTLGAYDEQVRASEAEQEAALQDALRRWQLDMGTETDAEGRALAQALEQLQTQASSPDEAPVSAQAAKGSYAVPSGAADRGAPPPAGTAQVDTAVGGERSLGLSDTSYSALMARQNQGFEAAKRFEQAQSSGPGWLRSLYSPQSGREQYDDPWQQAERRVGDARAAEDARKKAMRTDYEQRRAEWLNRAKAPPPVAAYSGPQPVPGPGGGVTQAQSEPPEPSPRGMQYETSASGRVSGSKPKRFGGI